MSKTAATAENVRVVVRLRPLSQSELDANDYEIAKVEGDGRGLQMLLPSEEDYAGNVRQKKKQFAMDRCLTTGVSQEQVFQDSGVIDLLKSALGGFSATVFAYGQTGSGKTYTMCGNQDLEWDEYTTNAFDGIIPRAIRYIFQQIAEQSDQGKAYTIRASFLEIYNEKVRDLWNPSSGALSIREYPPGYWGGFYVEDLYIFECTSSDDMMFMLWEGMRHRAVGSHLLNKDSSRSHSMLTLYLESEEEVDGNPYVKFGKISFVDLAGSERLKETQSGDSHGRDFASTFKNRASMKGDEMLKETGQINKSLFTLGKVISALGGKKKNGKKEYVPYRDSKLTKLLMDSLGGTSKALMFACCSPAASYIEETLNTLQYASRTMDIQNKPAIQVDPHEELVRELRLEMQGLNTANKRLRATLDRVGQASGCPDSILMIIDDVTARLQSNDLGAFAEEEDESSHEGVSRQRAPRDQRRLKDSRPGSRSRNDRDLSASELRQSSGNRRVYGKSDEVHEEHLDRKAVGRRGGAASDKPAVRAQAVGSSDAFRLPALDGQDEFLRSLEPRVRNTSESNARMPRGGGGGGGGGIDAGAPANQGSTRDPLLPDSLIDGSVGDWKNELDDEAREIYRELGLALYRATSQEEMSAAMRGLQHFEREHRDRADRRDGDAAGVPSEADAFRKMAMSFYHDDRPGGNVRQLTELSKMQGRTQQDNSVPRHTM